jgi:hypothetical protein
MRLLAPRDCGFQSPRGRKTFSLVIVVCCQVEVSESDRSLVQRSPTCCVVCLSVIMKLRYWPGLGPLGLLRNDEIWTSQINIWTMTLPIAFWGYVIFVSLWREWHRRGRSKTYYLEQKPGEGCINVVFRSSYILLIKYRITTIKWSNMWGECSTHGCLVCYLTIMSPAEIV